MSLSTVTAGTITYDAPGGLRPQMPFGSTISHSQIDAGIFPIPDGTSQNTGFQISPDDIDYIKGYYLKNNTGLPISYAPNDWDDYTLAAGDFVLFMSSEDGTGENPTTYMYIYTEQDQDGDGSVEFLFIGDNLD